MDLNSRKNLLKEYHRKKKFDGEGSQTNGRRLTRSQLKIEQTEPQSESNGNAAEGSVAADEIKANAFAMNVACNNEGFCRFGCVCESLAKSEDIEVTHCGKVLCMFECQCKESKQQREPQRSKPKKQRAKTVPSSLPPAPLQSIELRRLANVSNYNNNGANQCQTHNTAITTMT